MSRFRVRQKPPKLCSRAVQFDPTEPISDGRTLEGYAAVFETPTTIESYYGDFEEVIEQGAFKRTLGMKKPILQFDHGKDSRTGSLPIGTVQEIREDDHGLFVRARLFDNDVVEPIRQAIEAGALDGMSFRFRIIRETWRDANGEKLRESDLLDVLTNPEERGPARRIIEEVELFELGPVVFPAYEATSVTVRSMLAEMDEPERLALIQELTDSVRKELVQPCDCRSTEDRTASPVHNTSTVEGEWDASVNEKRIPSPMSVATARAMYAYYDSSRVKDGKIVKDACKLPHHRVSEDGRPGPAVLNGVRNALARLPQSDIPASEHEAIRRHLLNHLGENAEETEANSSELDAVTSDATPPEPERERSGAVNWEPAPSWYLPPPVIGP